MLSLKIVIGAIEIGIENCPSDEFTQTVKKALEAIEANIELTKRVSGLLGTYQVPKTTMASPISSVEIGNLSLTEVVRKSGARKGTDQVLVISFYLLKAEGQEIVNTKDLNDAFDKARLAKLGNLSQTLNTLVQGGRMTETQEKDSLKGFKITQTGEDEVRQMLEAGSLQK